MAKAETYRPSESVSADGRTLPTEWSISETGRKNLSACDELKKEAQSSQGYCRLPARDSVLSGKDENLVEATRNRECVKDFCSKGKGKQKKMKGGNVTVLTRKREATRRRKGAKNAVFTPRGKRHGADSRPGLECLKTGVLMPRGIRVEYERGYLGKV